ncbi:interferon regulatory factor 5 isoform X2 [Bombina bombina]|uniref:interferon regulatory factor 5 isoform X2 n=1 Tax=Bombina bombina TaxID=8345 RepID=UPI00235ADC3C|nr:interferon regulatory factor 5 isoform X2 [Bombina bombina]
MNPHPRRIRLKPWLVAQVNSGQYPGLQWEDQDHKLFRIPWRHATRHIPIQDDENTIFKAWAKETGKYQEGVDEPDPAKWKANLRCALNKSREFNLLYDGTKETPMQPFKIYQLCDLQGQSEEHLTDDYNINDEDEEIHNQFPTLQISDSLHPVPEPIPYIWPKTEPGFLSPCSNNAYPGPQHNLTAPSPVMPTASQGAYPGVELSPQGLVSQAGVIPLPEMVPAARGLETSTEAELPIQGVLPAPIEQGIPDLLISPQMLPYLIACQKGQTNVLPPYEIFFCFGEEWPDRKPKEKKLITVQVIPVAARLLSEIFTGESSWSADSIKLQISHPDLKDKMVEKFKELHQLWQHQHAQMVAPETGGPTQQEDIGPGPWPMHTGNMQ